MRHFLPFILLLTSLPLVAQQITFTATVDRNNIAVGEQVKLTITLTNGQGGFTHPNLGGLEVLAGPMESSSMNIINGRMSTSVSRTFILTATRPGDYTIGPAETRVGNNVIQTDPIRIKAEKGSGAPTDRQLDQAQQANRDLFVTLNLSREKVYVGEQVVATYTLYSRHANIEITEQKVPALTGFWAEEVDLGRNTWDDGLKVVNGLQYRTATLKRQVLFPQRAGRMRIEPVTLALVVNRNAFNPFWSGSRLDIKSNAVELQVLELPTGQPAGFSGGVGDLQLGVRTDRTTVPANEAITVKVKVSGRSNLKLLEAPRLDLPTDMDTYEPKVTDRITVNASGMSGEREFEYLVIPRHEGLYQLPPVTFSYFDTKSGSYRTLRSDSLRIEVTRGTGGGVAGAPQDPAVQRSDVRALGQDIRYIRTGDLKLRPRGEFLYGSGAYYVGLAAPAFIFLILLGWRRKQLREAADGPGQRRRRAERVARQRLHAASAALKNSDRTAFHDALAKALEGYFADRFNLGPAQVTDERVRQELSAIANGELADAFIRLKREAEMARFAPVAAAPSQALYDEAATLIQRIETSDR
ncbi:MAG: protein BatD [Flavobacteriales bacterium]|nr:protein BatD [Flavobacteriales bacterium]